MDATSDFLLQLRNGARASRRALLCCAPVLFAKFLNAKACCYNDLLCGLHARAVACGLLLPA